MLNFCNGHHNVWGGAWIYVKGFNRPTFLPVRFVEESVVDSIACR